MRQALESAHTTANLHSWIDLIFGYKQNGRHALEALNCYHPACYFGYPVDQISDTVSRKAIETMIKTWGQTPKQLFATGPHPPASRRAHIAPAQLALLQDTDSVHTRVHNVRWGSYVGSLEQALPPVCVYRESCKRNVVSLVAIRSNEVVGMAQNKCLLLDQADSWPFMAVVEWGFSDDFVKARLDGNDKPSVNLLPVRANENVVSTCCCIGSKYLVLGK
jgi:hypothetical protein